MDDSTSKNSSNTVLIVGLVLLAFVAGYLLNRVKTLEQKVGTNNVTPQVAGAQDQTAPQSPTTLKLTKPNPEIDHWRGDKNARFVMVEYSDLECPFCASYHPTAQKIFDENKGKVAWVYRHFPLSFHANAQKEAEASECAAEQGGNDAFWQYSDTIFKRTTSNGTGFALDKLGPLAAELGMNQQKLQSCLDKNQYEKKVKDQLAEGSSAGVAATPTTALYDMKTGKMKIVEGALPYESIKSQLEELMKG